MPAVAITPPVAVAAFAAGGIAGADPNEVGYQAVRLGIVAFIVAFVFVCQPALLLRGEPLQAGIAALTTMAGVISLAAALQGWLLLRPAPWERVLLFVAGLLPVIPGIDSSLAGTLVFSIIAARQWRRRSGLNR